MTSPLAALGLVAALAMPALAGEELEHPLVDPITVNVTANQTCGQLLGSWDEEDDRFEFKPNNGSAPTEGDHTDGTLEVNIDDLTDDSFSWSSNIGVDAVYVKGGNGGSYLYWYDTDGGPGEVTGDSGLTLPSPENNGISHVMFCYDTNDPTPTPTPTPTEEPSEEQTASPTPTPTEEPSAEETASPTPTERGDVLGGNPTPTPGGSLPDTAMGEWGQVPATVLSLILLGSLAAMVYVRLARQR